MANMAKSYIHEIPEGYEARIEGNKVIIELAESEDEKIREWLFNLFDSRHSNFVEELDNYNGNVTRKEILDWLEKQKEQKTIIKGWVARDKALQLNFYTNKPKRGKTYWIENGGDSVQIMPDPEHLYEEQDFDTLDWKDEPIEVELVVKASTEKRQEHVLKNEETGTRQEQKPASTEDMPYITDEHFFEREPVDSFKYKLAEYMTRCCTKKEGPYGHTYAISAESILEMAEEELLKRGELQKSVEWNEEDEKMLNSTLLFVDQHRVTHPLASKCYDWLKSLRPSWKPSEEQMNALNVLNCHGDLSYVGQQNQLISLQKDLEKLKAGVAPMREIDE